MSGKRLLDSLALLKASSAVVLKHVALRRQQVDVYQRTSSIAKILRSRTEWVTSIVESTPGNAFKRKVNQTDVGANRTTFEKISGLDDDHYHEKPETKKDAQPVPMSELNVQREKGESQFMRDGASPPIEPIKNGSGVNHRASSDLSRPVFGRGASISNDEGTKKVLQPVSPVRDAIRFSGIQSALLNPDRERDLQKHAENNIPLTFAEVQTVPSQVQQDFFYSPTPKSQVFSSLPLVKPPMVTEDTQDQNGQVSSEVFNQDVLYSDVIKKTNETPVLEGQAIPEHQQPSDEVFSEMFHGPRVAKMLRGEPKRALAVENSSLPIGQGLLLKHHELAQRKDQEKFNIRSSGQGLTTKPGDSEPVNSFGTLRKANTEEIRNLAEDLAKDSSSVVSATRGVRTDNSFVLGASLVN